MDVVLVHGAPERLEFRDFVADDQQLELGAPLRTHEVERFNQPLEILVGLDVADVKQIGMAQLVALPRSRDLLFDSAER